jgi:L-threonylcarbamoyladenylate synthase
MQIININGVGIDAAAVKKAVEVLSSGGVVMHATDTCYGLAVDISNVNALEKLYAIKKMSSDKPVSIMVANLVHAEEFAEFEDPARKLAEKFWPGPLTFVLKRYDSLPFFFNENMDSVGIRCPDSGFSLALIKEFGGPLTTTSANVTGSSEVYKVEDFLAQFGKDDLLPDLILDSGEIARNEPSTIIVFGENGAAIIREGSLGEKVREFLK